MSEPIHVPVTRHELNALCAGIVDDDVQIRARRVRLDLLTTPLRTLRSAPREWNEALLEALEHESMRARIDLYRARDNDGWIVSDKLGAALVPFEPHHFAMRHHDGLSRSVTLEHSPRAHVGETTIGAILDTVTESYKRPDREIVLRTDGADVMVNGVLAYVWVSCVAGGHPDEKVRVSFAKSSQWLVKHTTEEGNQQVPVRFSTEFGGMAWLAPLRALPSDADPILDLRGTL